MSYMCHTFMTLQEEEVQSNQLEARLHKQKQSTGNLMKMKIRLNSLMTHPLLQFNASITSLTFGREKSVLVSVTKFMNFWRAREAKSQHNFIIGIGRYQRNDENWYWFKCEPSTFSSLHVSVSSGERSFLFEHFLSGHWGFVIMLACFIGQKNVFSIKNLLRTNFQLGRRADVFQGRIKFFWQHVMAGMMKN